jgi:hypothetical protein
MSVPDTHPPASWILRIRHILQSTGSVSFLGKILVASLLLTLCVVALSVAPRVDFLAFMGASKRYLSGLSPYGFYPTDHGTPVFQSFPWVVWLFLPISWMDLDQAWILFTILNGAVLLLIILLAASLQEKKFLPVDLLLLFACGLTLSYLCLVTGQLTLLQAGVAVLMMAALERNKPVLAGALVPLILIKPHLVIWFLVSVYVRSGKRFLTASLLSAGLFFGTALALQPTWPADMIQIILSGQMASTTEDWKFATLTGLLHIPPWVGFLVLPVSLPLLFFIQRRMKGQPISAQMAAALAFSLAASPYAFAYDLPLLIPALLWLTPRLSLGTAVLWLAAAAIPIITGYSGAAYILTILTCGLILIVVLRSPPVPQPAITENPG